MPLGHSSSRLHDSVASGNEQPVAGMNANAMSSHVIRIFTAYRGRVRAAMWVSCRRCHEALNATWRRRRPSHGDREGWVTDAGAAELCGIARGDFSC